MTLEEQQQHNTDMIRARGEAWRAAKQDKTYPWVTLGECSIDGVTERYWYNVETGVYMKGTRNDLRPVHFAQNNAEEIENQNNRKPTDFRKVASIPQDTFFRDFREPWQQGDMEWVKRRLNDADFKKFRTHRGTL